MGEAAEALLPRYAPPRLARAAITTAAVAGAFVVIAVLAVNQPSAPHRQYAAAPLTACVQ